MAKPKPVNVQLIPFFEGMTSEQAIEAYRAGDVTALKPSEPYKILHAVLGYHPHLAKAKIVLAWNLAWTPDRDGLLTLGKCKKASDLDRELREWDCVILLNENAWEEMKPEQKAALVDHELCHLQVVKNGDDSFKKDVRGRICYRIRKHDLEEFREIVERHGMYKDDIKQFVRAARQRRGTLPFDEHIKEVMEEADADRKALLDRCGLNENLTPKEDDRPIAAAERNGEKPKEIPKTNGDTSHLPDDLSWRGVALDTLSIPAGLLGKLREASIECMGDLADFTKDGRKRISDIPGIGPASSEKIEEATTAFWARRKEGVKA